uniref:D-lactate dehydrogenase (cytochrome) n=1 Tax=Bursaphelenchus xylophilus TaxID=6326 RepID=A0A1I7S5Q9_BURXY
MLTRSYRCKAVVTSVRTAYNHISVKEKCHKNQPKFERLLGKENVTTSISKCSQFSADEGHFVPEVPDIVLSPSSTEEVSEILKICNDQQLPVVARGTGTGLEGSVIPIFHGVVLEFSRMKKVIEVNDEDFDCTVEPGLSRLDLNERLRESGLFFTVDPGADASVCGMVATSASGTTSLRYGTMKQNVKNLEVVLADGRILNTRGKHRRPWKSSSGLNLTELFVGSEGTLGVITNATVNLHPRPMFVGAATCSFQAVANAVETVVQLRQMGLSLARLEFLDKVQMKNCIDFSKLESDPLPTIFLEFHCQTDADVAAQIKMAEEICISNQSSTFKSTTNPENISNLWKARHNAYYATMAKRPGTKGFTTDVCVPLSRLVEVISAAEVELAKLGLHGSIVGHVGEGNFHAIIPTFHEDEKELKRVVEYSDWLVRKALEAGGTCTGEHGVGLGKKRYMQDEFGAVGVDVMKAIKATLDPKNILNPGKIF